MTYSNKNLRRTLRRQRLKLTPRERKMASQQAVRHLTPLAQKYARYHQRPIKMGIYLDAFGELPTQDLINWGTRHNFEIYVPVVTKSDSPLIFMKLTHTNNKQLRLVRHRLGMKQPTNGHFLHAKQLDMLFMPLVAFDTDGYRMGMGGGFYDRTLAKTKHKPLKIGYAYDFQRVEKLQTNVWDIRLDMAVTPSKLYNFKRYLLPKLAKSDNDKTDAPDEKAESDELSERLISQVMSVEKLEQLLAQANAFGFVNSERLDDF